MSSTTPSKRPIKSLSFAAEANDLEGALVGALCMAESMSESTIEPTSGRTAEALRGLLTLVASRLSLVKQVATGQVDPAVLLTETNSVPIEVDSVNGLLVEVWARRRQVQTAEEEVERLRNALGITRRPGRDS